MTLMRRIDGRLDRREGGSPRSAIGLAVFRVCIDVKNPARDLDFGLQSLIDSKTSVPGRGGGGSVPRGSKLA